LINFMGRFYCSFKKCMHFFQQIKTIGPIIIDIEILSFKYVTYNKCFIFVTY